MADPCSYEHFQQMLDSFFRQDDPPTRHNNVQGDEKPLDKTADTTEETTSSSFMYDPSKSFASWLSSQDYDSGNIAAVPDSPHLLGIDADDDDTTYLSEELRHNDGTSPEEMYDGSKSIAEWLSSRDADNVVLTSVSPQRRKAQFEGLMFHSAHGQVGGDNKNMSQYDNNGACNEANAATSAGMLNNICYGNEVARILSETCGCTIITQLNDLLDTTHCDGDIQDDNNENHYQDEILGVDEEAVEVPIDNELHHIRCNSNEEETSATERDDMEEICLNDTFEASLDDGIHNTNDDEESCKSEKEEKDDGLVKEEAHVPAVTPEKQLIDGEEASCAPEKEDEQDFPMDETTASAVRPNKSFDRYDSHLDDGARKKLSQMLLDSSLFHHQSNNNEWSSGFEPTNDAWRSGCSVDGEDINTVDLESLDDALNNHDEIFREPRAPPSLSQEVHLLGASFAASSASSDHDTIFERVLYEENRTKHIGHVDVSPLKKVAETRESFLDRTSRREDNHSRRSTISSKEDEPKGIRAQDISRREDDHFRLSSVGNGERGLKGRTQTYSRREDNHSRRSSISSREKELEGRTRDNLRREGNHSRLPSTRSKEEEPKVVKENTIIVMSVRGRKGKDKYARHARKQRLASKATSRP